MKTKKYIIGFVLVYLVGYLIYVYFFSIPRYNRLKNDYILSTCYSYDFSPGSSYKNNPPSIYYKYKVGDREYRGSTQLDKISSTDLQDHLLHKTFPVAIDKNDYSNSAVLIEPATFKEFKMPFPDSLKWIKEYLKD